MGAGRLFAVRSQETAGEVSSETKRGEKGSLRCIGEVTPVGHAGLGLLRSFESDI